MKRLNIKLVFALVVVTITVSVGAFFAHALQYGNAAESARQEADGLLKDGKRKEALKHYVLYIRQKESNVDPKVLVDTAQLAKSIAFDNPTNETVSQAKQLLHMAMRQLPDDPQIRQAYAEFTMKFGGFEDAIEPLVWLTAPQRGKHDPKLDMMLVECYVRRSYIDKAVDICNSLIGFNFKNYKFDEKKAQAPNEVEAYAILAHLLQESVEPKQPTVADQVMAQLVAVNKDSWQAHLDRARYLQQFHRGAGADADMAVALKLAPNEPDVIVVASQSALIDKKPADAEKLVERGLKLYPKNVNMYRQWAVLKSSENKLGDAEAQVQKGLKILPDNPELLAILCEIKLQQRDIPGARAAVDALKKTKVVKQLVDLMDARLLVYEGKWREAVQEFERLRPLLPDRSKQIDLYLADCYSQLGEFDKQMDAGNRLATADPASFAAQLHIASAWMSMGKRQQAEQKYEELARNLGTGKSMATPQIWRPILQLWIDEQMQLPKEKRNWQRVDSLIALLGKDDDANTKPSDRANLAAVELMRADVEMRKGNLKGARDILVRTKAKHADEPAVWSALATITAQLDGPAAALKLLDSAPAAIHDDVTLRLNRIGILMRQGGKDVKQSILSVDAGSDKLSLQDRARLWSGMGADLLNIGEETEAEKYWSKAAEASPEDLKIRFSLFDLAREIGDDAMMSKIVDEFRTLMGVTSAEARYADAARTVALVRKAVRLRSPTGRPALPIDDNERQELEGARKLLDEVSTVRANWYEVSRVMGDIELLEGSGHENDAVADYEKALQLGPPNPLIIRPLVMLLVHENKTDEAKKYLDMVGQQFMADAGLERVGAEVAVKSRDFDQAIERAKREVPDDSRDPGMHLWIGSLYDRAGRTQDAEASFRRAVATGPERPETWAGLLDHLAAHKKFAAMDDVLIQARKQLPEDQVNEVLGPGYELLGQIPQAEQYYKAALDAAPDDPAAHRMVASFYLRNGRIEDARRETQAVLRLSENDPKYKPNLIWARRVLAEQFARTGKYPEFLKAKALLQDNLRLTGETDDKLQLAKLLADRPGDPSQWREAVKLLESTGSLPPNLQVRLAQLHEELGDWTDARHEMVNFLTNPQFKASASAYAIFVDMLIRHDEIGQASTWMDQFDQMVPPKPGNGLTEGIALRSRILVKQGRIDEAVALLKSVVPSRPLPPDKLPILRGVGLQLQQLGLNAAAEELLREYVSYEPSGKLVLADLVGRTGRLDEALDLCEQCLPTFPLAIVMEHVSEIFQAQPSQIEPKQIERVAKWFQKALHDDPDSAPLLMQYARFRELCGELDDAEHIYRDLLRRTDLDSTQRSIALNNLSFSLASRKKDLAEALSYANEAVQSFGNNSDVLDTRGMVYVAMGEYAKALSDLKQAVLVANPTPIKLMHLALADDLSGDRSGAKASFQRAKEQKLDPTALGKLERATYDRLSKDLGP